MKGLERKFYVKQLRELGLLGLEKKRLMVNIILYYYLKGELLQCSK